MVVLDGYFEELPMDFITINNVQGAFFAVSYLHSLGYNRIGYLTSKVRTVNFAERHEGLNKAFKKLGLGKQQQDTFGLSPSLTEAHQDILAYLDKQTDIPIAFFADMTFWLPVPCRLLSSADTAFPKIFLSSGLTIFRFAVCWTPS